METEEIHAAKTKTEKIKTASQKIIIPKDGIEGLKENFGKDALSGFMVFLLALPLSLGIAKASDFPAIYGLVTAIIGGMVVSIFMGARLTIKGAAAGLIVIAADAVAKFGGGEQGWHLALGAIVVAGLVQILFGVLKLGKLSDFFPTAAIHGMLAAIGLIIISKQIHFLLGINPALLKDPITGHGKEPFELFSMIPHSIMNADHHVEIIGLMGLGILFGLTSLKKTFLSKIPAPLVVLILAIPLGLIFHFKETEPTFDLVKVGSIIDAMKKQFINVDFSGASSHTTIFIEYVILFALIGTIESLLTAKAMDGLDPYKRKTNHDKDLIAVGIGNTICGFLGGLPMISEVARSSANINNGAKTRWANFFHGLFMLLALLFAVPVIEMIPNAALAAMLIFVGLKLAHWKNFVHMWHVGKDQFIIFVATVIITLSTDLLIGVASGIALELIVNIIHGAKIGNLFKSNIEIHEQGNQLQLNIKGDAVFSNFLGLKKKIYGLPKGKHVIINLSNCGVIDHTTLHTLNDFKANYHNDGGKVIISGFVLHGAKGHHETSTRVKNK